MRLVNIIKHARNHAQFRNRNWWISEGELKRPPMHGSGRCCLR